MRVLSRPEPRQYRLQIARISEVQLAYAFGRSWPHQIYTLHEFQVGLDARLPFLARHALRKSCDDGKMEIFARRSIEQHSLAIDQRQFGAIAEKRYRRPLGDKNPQV